jgi:hypothetical protein
MNRKKNKQEDTSELRLLPMNDEEHVDGAAKYGCCVAATTASRWFVGILSIVVVIIVAPYVILLYNNNVYYLALQRYNLHTADGNVGGMMNFDSSNRVIGWNIFFLNGLTVSNTMSTMGIFGPLGDPVGAGPMYLPLCGVPSVYVCLSLATIYSTSPDGFSLTNFIATVRANPAAYYVNITSPTGTSILIPLGLSAGH